jgi:hypothetical protein
MRGLIITNAIIMVRGLCARVFCILTTYTRTEEPPETFRLIPFRQLPGGPAYDAAFQQRAVIPLAAHGSASRDRFATAMVALSGIPVA